MAERVIAGRYHLLEKIGAGGMGTVWRAADSQTHTEVAVKLLKPELTTDKTQLERFTREAEALHRLNHPNIVQVLATVDDPNAPALIMELVVGGSLDVQIRAQKEGGLPIRQTVALALELTDALSRAHHLGIIHRDIKPANVLLAGDGTPRLSDFGVARIATHDAMTGTDNVLGTLDYLSPEGLQGKPADARTDLWAFGVLLFEMLTGKRPFDHGNPGQNVMAILTETPPDLEFLRPDLPAGLVDVVYRLLIKDPAERLSSARQLGVELEAVLNDITSGTPSTNATRKLAAQAPAPKRFDSPTQTTELVRNNLPTQTTPFIGRESETATIVGLIHDPATRLITITAPGGMGKTRLALGAAEAVVQHGGNGFHDGIWFAGLAPITQPDQIIPTIASAMGFTLSAGGTPLQQLTDYLRAKHSLLVLDNFEHVMGGAGDVNTLLEAAPHVSIIVTSRERLNLRGETVYTLDGLDFPEWETPEDALGYAAVQLFTTSARRANPAFELRADDLQFVARICRLVMGMPLGIELAAAWAALLSPADIAAEIQVSLDFLESDTRDVPERHRSLRAAFEYSWALMAEDERDIFMQMAIFRGRFTRTAAQAVTGASLKTLMALSNKSLLKRDPDSGAYTLHELLRQYAETRLIESGYRDAVRQKHTDYYMGWLNTYRPDFEGKRQAEICRQADSQLQNIRAAWLWSASQGRSDLLAQAYRALFIIYDLRGRTVEMASLVDETLALLHPIAHSSEQLSVVKLLMVWRSEAFSAMQHLPEASAKLAEAQAITTVTTSDDLWAAIAVLEGFMNVMTGRREVGHALLAQAIERYSRLHDRWGMAWSNMVMGRSHWYRQANFDLEDSLNHLEMALAIQRELGDRYSEVATLMNIATIGQRSTHRQIDTQLILHQVADLYREQGSKSGMSGALNNLALSLVSAGRCAEATTVIPEMLTARRDLGRPIMLIWALFTSSFVTACAGHPHEALAMTTEALTLLESVPGEITWRQTILWVDGMVKLALGRFPEAVASFQKSIAQVRVNHEWIYLPNIAHGLIITLCAMGDVVTMRREVDAIRRDLTPMPDLNSEAIVQLSEGVTALLEGDYATAKHLLDTSAEHLVNRNRWQPSYVWEGYVGNSYACEVEAWRSELARLQGDFTEAFRLAKSCLEQALIADTVYSKGFACLSMIRLVPIRAGIWFGHLRAHPEYGAFITQQVDHIWNSMEETSGLERHAQRGEIMTFKAVAEEALLS